MNNLSNIGTIKDILNKYNFNFSKSLGQNFLINPSVCPKIAELGGANQNTGVIEIGTGFGVLTRELSIRAKKVVAIEIDKRLLPVLDETLNGYDNVKIINEDVLKVDLAQLIEQEFEGMDVYVCANLPYYITSPIIMSILEAKLNIKALTVMVQKEAGERITAKEGSKNVSSITMAVRYYSEPKILFNVSRGSFMPAPNVDSCVIRLDIKNQPSLEVADEKFLFELIRGSFCQRRKTFVNSVSNSLNIPKQSIIECLEQLNINPNIRPEQLHLDQFINISNLLKI